MLLSGAESASTIDWIARAASNDFAIRNFVDGRWIPSSGPPLEKYAPRDGKLISCFGAGESNDVEAAVSSAKKSFADGRWFNLSGGRRKKILMRLADLIEREQENLALLESVDVGKPIHDALNFDVPTAAATIRYNAEAADKLRGSVYNVDQANVSYQSRRPIGVVAGITAWNFPLVQAANKIGPALAAGNSLILKPSELTSLSSARLAELATEAGVPDGVLNVIHGDGIIGAALARHDGVNLVTFTGSTTTGKKLLVAAGESNMKRLIMECGGKSANVVFEDCPDLDGVAEAIVAGAFWNQGEVCVASARLLVHANIKEELIRLVRRKAEALQPGDPLLAQTRYGALVSEAHKARVERYIAVGKQEGASVVCKSDAPPPLAGGYYLAPVIFDEVRPNFIIAQEEIFGPVLSVLAFRDEAEAIAIANNVTYGLSATVWTTNLGRAHRLSQALDVGWVVVNATANPSGGPGVGAIPVAGHKQSGFGAEGGLEGLEAYLVSSSVQWHV